MKRKHNPLSDVPRAPCTVDSCAGLAFKPKEPLPVKSFMMYIVGAPGSGKSNLWQSFLTSKDPVYYRGFFDQIDLVSGSLQTISNKITKQLPEKQLHNQLSDTIVHKIITSMREGQENKNNLLVLDDVIADIKRSKVLMAIFLNRRHVTHSSKKKGNGGLATIITSQKYNALPLTYRNACSDVIVFKTSNAAERKAIKEELMAELSSEEQDRLMEEAWAEPYSFLYIKVNASEKYYIKFDHAYFALSVW